MEVHQALASRYLHELISGTRQESVGSVSGELLEARKRTEQLRQENERKQAELELLLEQKRQRELDILLEQARNS
jgi:cell division protein FtsB